MAEHQLSPACTRLTSPGGGVADSFDKASGLLDEMAGLTLSAATVRRVSERTGARIAELLGSGQTLGPAEDWHWHRDNDGDTVAYVSLDATGVPRQAGQGGAAEGRMAYVGLIYNPPPDPERVPGAAEVGEPMPARYVSGLYELNEMGPLLRRQGSQVGMDRADVWVALCDGGSGYEEFMGRNFPRVDAVILDFFHAAGYLGDLGRALYPEDEGQAKRFVGHWCELLRQEGGACTLAALQESGLPLGRRGVAEVWAEVHRYFENQCHRMEYPEYLGRGWYIGSGPVESGCKTVVNQRLKLAGMRWGEDGAHALCHLRALYRSEKGQWQAFWARPSPN